MIVTIERTQIIDHAEQLAKMIIDSDIAETYRRHLNTMKSNKETQRKIQRFVKLKKRYEEVERFGKYHPDYKTVMAKIREAKREMDMDEHVANFKRAETDLQNLLDEISVLIGHSVSPNIKISTGNPFFETANHGGCSVGGSCNCNIS